MKTNEKSLIRQAVCLAATGVAIGALYLCISSDGSYADTARIGLRVTFIIWTAMSAIFLLRLRAAFHATEEDGSSFIAAALHNGIVRTLWDIYRRQSFLQSRLWLLYVIWSIMIIGVVVALSVTGRLDDAEAHFLLELGPGSTYDTATASQILFLETADNNPTNYLRDLAKISSGLKRSGARAVVARVPAIVVAKPVHLALVDSIERTGIAILYSGHGQPGSLVFPFLCGADKATFSRHTWFVEPVLAETQRWKGLIRWSPSDSTTTPVAVDALTEAAARCLGSSDTLCATLSPKGLTYGKVTATLNARRQAAVFLPLRHFRGRAFLNVHAIRELDSDTLRFYSSREWRSFSSFPPEFSHEVKDRIVFVAWIIHPTQMDWSEVIYANIVEALLRNNAVKEFDYLHLVTACLVVVLSALFCLKFRPGVAASTILAGGVALLVCSTVLLATHHILLQAAYPAAAAFLSGVIFPLVRLSHERA